jgi:hypothetical protein
MAGNDAIGQRRRQRLEDRVDDGHRKRHPHPHRRRLLRADDTAGRQYNVERAELSVIDRQIERRCQTFECNLAAGAARGLARIVEARDLLRHVRQIDLHAVAGDLDLDADRNALAECNAVVVHIGLRLIDAVGHLQHALAR